MIYNSIPKKKGSSRPGKPEKLYPLSIDKPIISRKVERVSFEDFKEILKKRGYNEHGRRIKG